MKVGDFVNDVKHVNEVSRILQKTHEEIALIHPIIAPDLMSVVAENIIHFAIMYCIDPPTQQPSLERVERLKNELPKIEEKTVKFIKKELRKRDLIK